MIAELLANTGNAILGDTPPDGRGYWAARYWDRDAAESHPVLRDSFLQQKAVLGKYLAQYGQEARRVLEFACGTGQFTRMAVDITNAPEIVAVDISKEGLAIARTRVPEASVTFRHGDFWDCEDLGTADLVQCVDAIHHLGDVRDVLTRLHGFVEPGGLLVGNVWIKDHYHEFQRKRYGMVPHLCRTAGFLGTAVLIRVSNGRLRTGAYRTQLRSSDEVREILRSTFAELVEVTVHRYFMSFVCRA